MTLRWGIFFAGMFALAACNGQPAKTVPQQTPAEDATSDTAKTEGASILRTDADVQRAQAPLEPLEARISFNEGGFELSGTAITELEEMLKTRQMAAGGTIVLRGHTDSAGNDQANLRASQKRAIAVRDWLVENDVEPSRISVIAMGEQNPARPNGKPDGTPDEEARAFNRRVDVTIAVPEDANPAETAKPTLVEQVTNKD